MKEQHDFGHWVFRLYFILSLFLCHRIYLMYLYATIVPCRMQIANVVFFLVTVFFLVDHWRTASTLTKSGENRGNFLIVIKLFFIMGRGSIEEEFIQKKRQRSSLLLEGQNFVNSLPC